MKGVLLQFTFFITEYIFSHSYARLTFCGDCTRTIGTTVCTSLILSLLISSFYDALMLFLYFLPEEGLLIFLAYLLC
jgi:hypothetical protein